MGKRKKVIIVAAIVAAILVIFLGIMALIKYLGPSTEKAQYEAFTKLEEDQVAMLLDYEFSKEYAMKIGKGEKVFIPI